jgi:hypothetical protein
MLRSPRRNTSTYYVCSVCQSHYEQPLGKLKATVSENGTENHTYKVHSGISVSDTCPECHSTLHVRTNLFFYGLVTEPDLVDSRANVVRFVA